MNHREVKFLKAEFDAGKVIWYNCDWYDAENSGYSKLNNGKMDLKKVISFSEEEISWFEYNNLKSKSCVHFLDDTMVPLCEVKLSRFVIVTPLEFDWRKEKTTEKSVFAGIAQLEERLPC